MAPFDISTSTDVTKLVATRTVPLGPKLVLERQAATITVIPGGEDSDAPTNNEGNNSLGSGSIAAIILGSILGVILIIIIIRWASSRQIDDYESRRTPPVRDYYYTHERARPHRSRRSPSGRLSVETTTMAQPVQYPAVVYNGGGRHSSHRRSRS